jgi:repressor LexA
MESSLTGRQQQVLDYLREYQESQGMAPSIPDICTHFGFASPRAAAKLLEKLEAQGAISRNPGARRAIRILWPAAAPRRQTRQLPLLGRIAAGTPITAGCDAIEEAEMIDIDPALFDTPPNLLWQVEGYSMVNLGILPGDIVGTTFRSEFKNRQIVAAVVIDERTSDPTLTLKRYEKKGSVITLTSENDDQITYRPMVFDTRRDAVQIIGIYSGLVRRKVQ